VPPLRLYSGAGLRPAVEKLVAAFEARTGIRVEPDYGGSGLVLSRAREDADADLFLPGDGWYVDRLQELSGRVAERAAVAYFVPVIIVAPGNPRGVKSVGDLARDDVRVGLGKADACQVGRASAKILANAGVDPGAVNTQESLTVNELGVWVQMKSVDAAIVWDAIAANMPDDVEQVAIAPEHNVISRVVLARLEGSRHPAWASRFLAFVQGPEGRRILREAGYRVDAPEGAEAAQQ
jgi:molybdate transport system substrate-binding protein